MRCRTGHQRRPRRVARISRVRTWRRPRADPSAPFACAGVSHSSCCSSSPSFACAQNAPADRRDLPAVRAAHRLLAQSACNQTRLDRRTNTFTCLYVRSSYVARVYKYLQVLVKLELVTHTQGSMVKSHEGANYGGTDTDSLGEKLRLERMSPTSATASATNGEYRPHGLAAALANNADFETAADTAGAPIPYRNGSGIMSPASSNPFTASSAFR